MWYSNACRTCACLCLYLLVGTVGAALDDASTIDLSRALARALADHPALVAVGFQIEAAEGRLLQSGLRPNPELDIALQDALGTGEHSSFDRAETTVSLSWLLERGLRARIVDAARAGLAVTGTDADIARIDVGAETARRFVECLAYQARLERAVAAVGFAADRVTAVRARVDAGRAPEAELARAEAALARAELLEEDYEHELLSAYHRLGAQWGALTPDFARVSGDLETLPSIEPFETLAARIEANPELLRYASEERLAEAELRLAEAQRRRPWRVSAGLRRVEREDDFALVGTVSVPLSLRDRNQGRIAAARAERAQTAAEAEALRVAAHTTLFVLYQELLHNLQLAERMRADVIPRIELALADSRRAYELGRYSYFEWSTVQTELLVAGDDLLEASIAAHELVIEIERLTGTPVPRPRNQ